MVLNIHPPIRPIGSTRCPPPKSLIDARLPPHQARTRELKGMLPPERRDWRHTPTAVPSNGFHQNRLAATEPIPGNGLIQLESLTLREAMRDDELERAAWLRARSFYAYPPERKFAGEIHQIMVAEEEFKALKTARLQRTLSQQTGSTTGGNGASREDRKERSACLIALAAPTELATPSTELDENMRLTDDGHTWLYVVGSLDLYAMRALPGEVLIGGSPDAAYLANVCTASVARRRGVGEALVQKARSLAREWGVEQMYVHTQAVNEIARRFYQRLGFVVEKEETANHAHYRGHCLDGIEGRGRTVLLRDTRLYDPLL